MEVASELESRFKEVLYRCLEEIQATKAALYLRGGDGTYEVVASYGFKKGLRDAVEPSDEIVDRLLVRRSPYAINGLAEDSLFSELLYEADTSRILVTPIYSRGKLAGFLDIRDKAAGHDFESDDFSRATSIADEYLEVFTERGMYGQRKIALGEVPVSQRTVRGGLASALPTIIQRAESEIERGVLLEVPSGAGDLDKILEAAAGVLPAFLGLRAITVAAVSVISDMAGSQRLVAKGDVSPESIEQFNSRLQIWLERRGEDLPYMRTEVSYPFGARESAVTPDRIKEHLGALVRAAEPQMMILSVVFDQTPDEDTRAHLEQLHEMLEEVIESAIAVSRLRSIRESVAFRLLEPDLEAYPDLLLHSQRVARLAEECARQVGWMSEGEIEKIRLAGIVHDVGLRPIGYHRVQRKGQLTEEELMIVRKHPVVGGAIVSATELGIDIARMVYFHHERFDGTGYPDGIPGQQIPVGARIIHLCEAYDAMTSDHSYKPPIDRFEALERIRKAAGSQFDPELTEVFCTVVENS